MFSKLETFVTAVVFTALGFAIGCVVIVGSEPDRSANPQACVPIYDQTGLECCQSNTGDPE